VSTQGSGRSPVTDDARGPADASAAPAVRACRIDDVPADGCLAVLEGRVLLARVGDDLVAYRNQCLHKATPLDGGLVRDGIVTCPLHFWRYDLADGRNLAGGGSLERLQAWTDGSDVLVVPPPEPTSLRQLLRDHARDGAPTPKDEST
jgi:nitrite reductase/ring-hydroxylating ferredoxin subunit